MLWLGWIAIASGQQCLETLTRDLNCNSVDADDELLVDVTDPLCAANVDPATGAPFPNADEYVDHVLLGCRYPVTSFDPDEDGFGFGQIEVSRGILPFGGATIRFPRAAGWSNAMRWILTGDEFDAAEAHRIGIVQDVVKSGAFKDFMRTAAREIARGMFGTARRR